MLALAAAALLAAPVSVTVPEYTDAIAYADGRVLWADHSFAGDPIVLRQRPVGGGPASVLATIRRADRSSEDVELSLAANAGAYVLTVRERDTDRVFRGGYDGSLTRLAHCKAGPAGAPNMTAVAGVSGFAFAGDRCVPAIGVVDAGGAVTRVNVDPPDDEYELAYREPYLALTDGLSVRLIDLSTGAQRLLPEGYAGRGSALGLLPDGTLVSGPPGPVLQQPSGIYAWPPGAARPTLLTRLAGVGHLFAAGGRVLFDGRAPLGLVGLGGGRVADVAVPGAGAAWPPLAFDGRHAAFVSISCRGAQQVTVVDVDAPPAGVPGCPVRVASRRVRFDRSGRATLAVVCPNGCRGTELRLLPRRWAEPFATGRLRLPASPAVQRVTVRRIGRLPRRRTAVVELWNAGGLALAGSHRLTVR